MSRNGSGVYSLPSGSTATDGTTIEATQHNTPLADLEMDANTARPIVAGGTGATTATTARTNLGVGTSDNPAFAGATFTSVVSLTYADPFLVLNTTDSLAAIRFDENDVRRGLLYYRTSTDDVNLRLFEADGSTVAANYTFTESDFQINTRLKLTHDATDAIISNTDGDLLFKNSSDSVAATMEMNPDSVSRHAETVIIRNKGDTRYTLASSDKRLKSEIKNAPDMLGRLMQLRPVTFGWKEHESHSRDTSTRHVGLIAQEVEAVFPGAVINGDDLKGLDALNLIGVLVKSVQELSDRVESLEARP